MVAQPANDLAAHASFSSVDPRSCSSVELTYEIFTSFAHAESFYQAWDALVRRISGSLFQSPDWIRLWWTHYGQGRALRLMVFRVRGELVGLVPLCIEQIGFWPLNLRVARLLSSDSTIAICDPPVDLAWAREIYQVCFRLMLQEERCDAVHLGPISASYPCIEGLRSACQSLQSMAVVCRDHQQSEHMTFDLTPGFTAVMQGLSNNQRSNYRRNLNNLARHFRFSVNVVKGGDEAEAEFENFMTMHRLQWQAVNRLGHFGDWPGSSEFHRDVVRIYARAHALRLVRLMADDAVVAYYYCIEFGGAYYWLLPARKVGENWDRFGLGRVGLLKMLEEAASEPARSVEAGPGRYKYKEQLNGVARPIVSMFVAANRPGARARSRVAVLIAQVLHELYYRQWFLKLAPQLPLARRPLHRWWIRTRF